MARKSPEQSTGPDATGMTTVPRVAYGISVEDALALLDESGLKGVAPEVDSPHYATGTKPPAGTTVQLGSTVKITIGDG